MYIESVEIYSDATNGAVMRHPGRHFPGVLVQGDTLYSLCSKADEVSKSARQQLDRDTYVKLNDLRNNLWSVLRNYKAVLAEHGISLPFSEQPP